MTTTLRPTGPTQQSADGARSRTYDVCDNGRPVGTVTLATDPAFGPAAGVLDALRIDEHRRRRGRAIIASLAAEEVLRAWGCVEVRAEVPAGNEPALRLAAVLGYTERGRNMDKATPARAAALPPGLVGRPMTAREFTPWLADRHEEYAREWARRGVPEELARHKSATDHARLLPLGLATPGTSIDVLVREEDGRAVGHVWLAGRPTGTGGTAGHVYYVEVDPEFRGRGYGRALMGLAEDMARGAGFDRISLHVFTSNTPARALYASLGYEPTSHTLVKPL
ncbi:GNAT family N-acetyltransferase [Streptomyces sp. NBC_01218]|uniref:GNAT family N-acetyltransferase n=1 Tax=unclassified Streptomyces TaxID=2593676 RepID=UPI0023B9FCE8|nr:MULTISPECIES: GNAT family N-acetyltransferase [unclassified Streptomyces]WEH42785.1 GNAT family N-acetyltransferase [Streptomyces sp. AM 2-1-1]WSQ54421.1 GNAT family N-acetyltransferase [Streptomyces sp. NBC_01218]